MPVNISIEGDKNVFVYFKFQTPWTIQEFLDADMIAGAWARNLDYSIDAIFDLSDVAILPSWTITEGLNAIRRTQKQPNQGDTVIIARNTAMKNLIQIIASLAPDYGLHVAQNRYEAEQIINTLSTQQTLFYQECRRANYQWLS